MICEICGAGLVKSPLALFGLPTVTSDCRPWVAGRSVNFCPGCGVMKRIVVGESAFSGVYDNYTSYPEPTGRTARTLTMAMRGFKPKKILDVGCGAGEGLKILAEHFPKAKVQGYDPYSGNPAVLKERPNNKYDLVTMFQVLEHIEDVHEILAYIKSILSPKGTLLIEVPYIIESPFDLILADHIWHFTIKSLTHLLSKAGFFILLASNGLTKKIITIIATPHDKASLCCKPFPAEGMFPNEIPRSKATIEWLLAYSAFLEGIDEPVIVYGSGPAAAWAGSILGAKVQMYIDDDVMRQGATFNGRSIVSPAWVNPGEGAAKPLPVVAPFPDWQLPEIKARNPGLIFCQ